MGFFSNCKFSFISLRGNDKMSVEDRACTVAHAHENAAKSLAQNARTQMNPFHQTASAEFLFTYLYSHLEGNFGYNINLN